MSMLQDPDFQERDELMEAYRKLEPPAKDLLEIMSVVGHSISRSSLVKCLRRLGIRTSDGGWYTAASLTPILRDLERQERLVLSHSTSQWRCVPLIREAVARALAAEGRFEALTEVVDRDIPLPAFDHGGYPLPTRDQWSRAMRRSILCGNIKEILEILSNWASPSCMESKTDLLFNLATSPFDAGWIAGLDSGVRAFLLDIIGERAFDEALPLPGLHELLVERARDTILRREKGPFRLFLAREMIFRGELPLAGELLSEFETKETLACRGWFELVRGGDALPVYEEALRKYKSATGKRKVVFDDPAGAFYPLALLHAGTDGDLKKALDYVEHVGRKGWQKQQGPAFLMQQLFRFRKGRTVEAMEELKSYRGPFLMAHPLEVLFHILVLFWTDRKSLSARAEEAAKTARHYRDCGYFWIAAQLEDVLFALDERRFEEAGERSAAFFESSGAVPLAGFQEPKEEWERGLEALSDLFKRNAEVDEGMDLRLVWRLNWLRGSLVEVLTLEPVEQKLQKNGSWSRGRVVSFKRLYEEHYELDYLSELDHRICDCIDCGGNPWGSARAFELDVEKALPHLVDHPLLFTARQPVQPVSVVRGEPEVRVIRKKTRIRIEFHPPVSGDLMERAHVLYEEAPARLRFIPIREEHRAILGVLGDRGLSVPAQAEEKVRESLTAVASVVEIHSDIGGVGEDLVTEDADSRVRLQLEPAGEGLVCRALVRPLGGTGQGHFPGKGGGTVLATRGGRKVQVCRDLEMENQNLDALLEACPSLSRGIETGEAQWVLENPGDCLGLLVELGQMGEAVVTEWPQGEVMKVYPRLSFGSARLTARAQKEWFALSGQVEIGDGTVMELGRLLDLMEARQGDFIPIGEGQFLALTREFRMRLEEFVAFGQRKGDGVRLSALGIPLLEDLPDRVADFDADVAWEANLARFREAETLEVDLPSTLRAEMRDYQAEGFRWLARRAHWGVGACLADDMGLGKTVQALALMIHRASEGPALVVAPTSVCANWPAEAARFAPTLNLQVFGPGDRRQMVQEAGPFDVVVTSYGLLQQEADLFASREWHTIVLDEAQAIKNGGTQRSRAAMKLDGNFRMIATGTPVENHLGELWNLFRFINPGLLGSQDRFNKRFAIPIERNNNREVRSRLRKLVHPFILRRTKNQVLEELPERTEIRVSVEMSRDERALYEALRRKALKKLESHEGPENPGEKRFAILAEITRLRRACCHPELVAPEMGIAGSKLEAFSGILEDLRENGHKALVFSQFVDHLAILRRHLDERQVPYQYLDGSTPARQRSERIRAFQAGEGDCFLISLKAGGLGLNLTAADYVIHMDPWWNPAVEDQASDRAHRIGQTRPVTIYRMVTAGSIEEKILELHGQKRDLADSLLAGTDAGGRINAEELMRLIRE